MHAVSLLLAWGGGLMKENSYGGNALSITGTAARINTEVLVLELVVRSNASQSYIILGISLAKAPGQSERALTYEKLCKFGP